MSIASVIVTHNRKEMLLKCLHSIHNQDCSLDCVYLVLVACNDGTKEFIQSNENLPKIKYIEFEGNVGGAGGFSEGLKQAVLDGHDWVWLMDDDASANPDALSKLINHPYAKSKDTAILNSRVLWKDNLHHVRSLPLLHPTGYAHDLQNKSIRISASTFVSCLIKSAAVLEKGLPYKEFFIWFDDAEYTGRILKNYRGYLIGESIVYHHTSENEPLSLSQINPQNNYRFFCFIRNRTFHELKEKLPKRVRFLKHLNDFWEIISCSQFKLLGLKVFFKGLLAGYRFSPKIDYIK